MNIVLRKTRFGTRAFPISKEEFDEQMAEGKLRQVSNGLYEEVTAPVVEDQAYMTRDMKAEKPDRRNRRNRAVRASRRYQEEQDSDD